MIKTITPVVLAVFFLVAVFGLFGLLSHDGHHVGCPLMGASEVMCESTIAEHFSIWGSMFASVLILLVLSLIFVQLFRIPVSEVAFAHVRYRRRIPARPLLFQELYSAGILNRKEPSFS